MILLDTDIITLFHVGNQSIVRHIENLATNQSLGTTVITEAEILRARYSFLLKAEDSRQLIRAQDYLERSKALLADLVIVGVDEKAGLVFDELRVRKSLRKVGIADLLIASIALAHGSRLITRNLRHFRQIPDLEIENWAD